MVVINQQSLTMVLSAILVTAAIGGSSFGAVYADGNGDRNGDRNGDGHRDGNNDKVKLDCLDAALTLVTLDFAIDLGGDDLETDLSSTLDEAEIAPDLESIEGSFENALDDVKDKCDEENVQDILEFIDFSD